MVDTPENHGPIINVVTWFLLVAAVLWVVTRIGTKFAVSRGVAIDDILILISLVRGLV